MPCALVKTTTESTDCPSETAVTQRDLGMCLEGHSVEGVYVSS
jgi:hypothetical protein